MVENVDCPEMSSSGTFGLVPVNKITTYENKILEANAQCLKKPSSGCIKELKETIQVTHHETSMTADSNRPIWLGVE